MTNEQDDKLQVSTDLVPVDRHELATFKQDWTARLEEYKEIPCTDAEQAGWWTMWRNHAHEQLQARDEERKAVSGPYYNDFTTINKWFKDTGISATQFKELANKKLESYELAREAASQAAVAAAQLAAESGDEDAVYEALAAIPDVQRTDGNTNQFYWEVDEIDLDAMKTHPTSQAYLMVDTKKLAGVGRAAAASNNPAPSIPGVTWKRSAKSKPTGKRT